MSRKLSLKHSAVAYLLNKEMGYTQLNISSLMGVSQGTVSNMIKDFEHEMQIKNLQKELDQAYQIIKINNLLPEDDDFFPIK